jgi:hypothetical protein
VAQGSAYRDLALALRERPRWRTAAIVPERARPPGEWRRLVQTRNGGIRVDFIAAP